MPLFFFILLFLIGFAKGIFTLTYDNDIAVWETETQKNGLTILYQLIGQEYIIYTSCVFFSLYIYYYIKKFY